MPALGGLEHRLGARSPPAGRAVCSHPVKSFLQLDPAWPARYGQWVMLGIIGSCFPASPNLGQCGGERHLRLDRPGAVSVAFLALWLRYLWPERLPALLVMILGLPFLVSATLAGLMGRLYLNDQIGVVTRLLHGMGLLPSGDAPLGSVTGTWLTIGVVDAWRWVPFTALLFWLLLRALPKRQIEAAQLDGIPWPTALWHVYLPFLAAPVAIVLLLRLLEAFRAHDLPQVLSGGGPGVSTLVASIFAARITFGHRQVRSRGRPSDLDGDRGLWTRVPAPVPDRPGPASSGRHGMRRRFLKLITVTVLGAIGGGPLIWLAWTSLLGRRAMIEGTLKVGETSLQNYKSLAQRLPLGAILGDSALVAAAAALGALVLAVPTSYYISRHRGRASTLLYSSCLTLWLVPPVTLSLQVYFWFQRLGWYDTEFGLILLNSTVQATLVIILLTPFLDLLPRRTDEAAWLEGMSGMQVLLRVQLPALAPLVAAAGCIAFVLAWNELLYASLLTASHVRSLPVSMFSYHHGNANRLRGQVAALGTLSVMPLPIGAVALWSWATWVRAQAAWTTNGLMLRLEAISKSFVARKSCAKFPGRYRPARSPRSRAAPGPARPPCCGSLRVWRARTTARSSGMRNGSPKVGRRTAILEWCSRIPASTLI